MVRAFHPDPIEPAVLDRVLRAGLRGPSAGFTQGIDLLVLTEESDCTLFWEAETDADWRRDHPGHARTRQAPAIVIPLTGSAPYTLRYSEPDKAPSGLGRAESWPVPFWWFDAGACVMAMLLAATAEGLAALFMGIFRGESSLRERFGFPPDLSPAGALLLGRGAPDRPSPSLARGHRPVPDRVHLARYGRSWPES